MNDMEDKILEFSNEIKVCQKVLIALGDSNRQYLILEMMKIKKPGGLRVIEITEKTNLSRPAISHHLQILKDAGIISMRKEGTKNYYYFDHDQKAIKQLIETLNKGLEITSSLPNPENYQKE